jgi:hypothetical protein
MVVTVALALPLIAFFWKYFNKRKETIEENNIQHTPSTAKDATPHLLHEIQVIAHQFQPIQQHRLEAPLIEHKYVQTEPEEAIDSGPTQLRRRPRSSTYSQSPEPMPERSEGRRGCMRERDRSPLTKRHSDLIEKLMGTSNSPVMNNAVLSALPVSVRFYLKHCIL